MSAEFTLYAVDCIPFGGLPSEHTYVETSDGENFNCFGRSEGGRVVCKSTGSSKWAKLVYGDFEGRGDDQPAAMIRVRYDGVCQNSVNRLLVLTGDSVDARGTKGNLLATLMFGKLGFNLDPYIAKIKSTGAQLLQDSPGEIQPSDIETVLARVIAAQTPDVELDMLHADAAIQGGTGLVDITDAQKAAFRPIYTDYQRERNARFLTTAANARIGEEIAKSALPKNLLGPLTECVERLVVALGPDQFKSMFGVAPAELKQIAANVQF